jgi:hypothetical protein
MKGGDKRKGNINVAYLWNIMDRDSRFLIASKLTPAEKTGINIDGKDKWKKLLSNRI